MLELQESLRRLKEENENMKNHSSEWTKIVADKDAVIVSLTEKVHRLESQQSSFLESPPGVVCPKRWLLAMCHSLNETLKVSPPQPPAPSNSWLSEPRSLLLHLTNYIEVVYKK